MADDPTLSLFDCLFRNDCCATDKQTERGDRLPDKRMMSASAATIIPLTGGRTAPGLRDHVAWHPLQMANNNVRLLTLITQPMCCRLQWLDNAGLCFRNGFCHKFGNVGSWIELRFSTFTSVVPFGYVLNCGSLGQTKRGESKWGEEDDKKFFSGGAWKKHHLHKTSIMSYPRSHSVCPPSIEGASNVGRGRSH